MPRQVPGQVPDQAELLESYRRWLLKLAWEFADSYHDAHDLAQEGWVAMWRATSTYDPARGVALGTHLMSHARWRILDVVARGDFTGMPSRQGRHHTAGTQANRGRELPADLRVSTYDTAGAFEELELAYHHGEIYEAVDSLPPQQRERVYQRFWLGVYDPKNSAWWYARRIGARDRLAARLGHLADEFGGRRPVQTRAYRPYRRSVG